MDLTVDQQADHQTYLGDALRHLPPLNGFFEAGIATRTDPTLPEDKKLVVFDIISVTLAEDEKLNATRQAALKSAYWAWKILDDQYVDKKSSSILCLRSRMLGFNPS